ncbi:TonB-dependent receptor [Mucilaginibacter paludis DSM 18603]|uniref:TonB-dependent receptor n=2 Tax=Mucilaginibacter TaxID=423349 RepID=H1Y5E0_9SPHI|nr:TonB-dependent receptor [Mucilaginibacter paludis DSM 18603]
MPKQHIYKLLLIMRLTIIILIATMMQVSAGGFGQSITLNTKNAPLSKIIREIRTQSGYDFFYNKELIKNIPPLTIDVKNASVEDVLNQCLNGSALTYKIDNKVVMIKEKPTGILDKVKDFFALPIDVNGRVVDSTGVPLIGASIYLKAEKKHAVADVRGEFSLRGVQVGSVLEISYIGFVSQQVTVTRENAGSLSIVLKADISKLQEVAVVSNGYQTIAKERSAGAFAKPDMKVIENRSTSMNILQRLDGLVPGLTVNNDPGHTGSPYLIRGLTSVSISSSPLYVVDGIQQTDVSNINPQDVADITVLKDATAASIWGSRAANGVIVIVTKKGTRGDKIKVNYDAFVNFQGKPDINYFPVLNSQQFIQAAKETFDPVANTYANATTFQVSSAGLAPHESILYNQYLGKITAAQANKSLDSLASISNNQQIKNLFYRNAMLMNHTLSVSGGQKNYSVYGSMAYTDNRTSSPGQSNDTYKINLRQDFNVGKRIQLSLITDLTNNIIYSPRNISPTDQFYPYQLFQDNAGNNISMPYMTTLNDATRIDFETRSRINLDYNPLNEVNLGNTKTDMLLSRNVFSANVKLIDGLNFEGTYGYTKGATRAQNFDDQQSYKVRSQVVQFTVAPTAASTPVYYLPATGANYAITNLTQRNWTVRNQLSYNKSWNNGLHQLTMLAGQEAQEQYSVTNTSSIKGWDPLLQTGTAVDYKTVTSLLNGVVWPNYAATYSLLTDGGYFSENEAPISRFVSYYANAAYTFNHKYTINGSYRIDQSNNFGIDKAAQNKPVWSVGGKWLMTEEKFMKDVTWVDNLALRATYGITGNAPQPGTAASYDIISVSSSSFLPNSRGLQVGTPANRKLTWESTATINLGLDFSVFKNRLSGAVDIYRKKTTNLLGNVTTNGFTGYPTIFGNLGDLQNKGIELSLTSVNIRTRKFGWSTTLNGAYNKNVITSLNISAPVTTGSGTNGMVNQQFVTGYAGYALFAYEFAGLDNLGDPQIRLANGTVTKTPNISKPGDIKYMGTTQPPWSGGLSNNFNYQSFGLSFNAIFNLGHVMRRDVDNFYYGNLSHSAYANGFTTGNINAEFANRWKQPGDELTTNVPSYVSSSTISTTRRDVGYYTLADINVLSASFIKMRDITLTYSLPRFLVKKINADQITLRAQVSNLMIWKANKYGIDPEFQYGFGGSRSIPTNQGTVSFGLNVRL